MADDPARSVGAVYQRLRASLREAGVATPELDARMLVGEVAGIEPSQLPLHLENRLSNAELAVVAGFAAQRLDGKPVGRILGKREFWGLEFQLNDATLEPRPDTETLVEAVLRHLPANAAPVLADVGTGSGAIAIALLHEVKGAHCLAVDISAQALQQACANAARHGVAERFWPVQGDYLDAVGPQIDWIISNPPYIATSVVAGLEGEVRLHDPNRALDGGADGLAAYRALAARAAVILPKGGRIALEIGYDQADSVVKLLQKSDFKDIEIVQDLAGQDRVIVALRQ
ncbi:peptide chain release factor N(5)-glutamine methyltransferase [Roseibium sp.]|uniref:peptide chain release factor N(5)-glutamine methyltransferase n=1 Tax=Roseibium sp. TaxID=1936156 RepID=UPI003A981B3E